MSPLGRLLRNRRADEGRAAWHLPHLQCAQQLALTSEDFGDGDAMPRESHAKHIGGADRSPHLSWSPPPAGTVQLLLVVEDIDVPLRTPAVHCVALIDPAVRALDPGALDARRPAAGVRPLRSTIGRGYHGPAPVKGHGPHRYVFQLFALSVPAEQAVTARPRAFLSAVPAAVLARGRLTGTHER
ncbi:YbhB/YbcL family Raf kinase inhibitor-like protein [Actinacidiphila alni]|uniref:YbhB/YbcL family Raf kinase inhibitor-like protein n=1 Tax=Actinacidiphila alni TaxID=380248 RepID=UPI0033D5305E